MDVESHTRLAESSQHSLTMIERWTRIRRLTSACRTEGGPAFLRSLHRNHVSHQRAVFHIMAMQYARGHCREILEHRKDGIPGQALLHFSLIHGSSTEIYSNGNISLLRDPAKQSRVLSYHAGRRSTLLRCLGFDAKPYQNVHERV